jgi:hypothetical protein
VREQVHEAVLIGSRIDCDENGDKQDQQHSPEYGESRRGKSKQMSRNASELLRNSLPHGRLPTATLFLLISTWPILPLISPSALARCSTGCVPATLLFSTRSRALR